LYRVENEWNKKFRSWIDQSYILFVEHVRPLTNINFNQSIKFISDTRPYDYRHANN